MDNITIEDRKLIAKLARYMMKQVEEESRTKGRSKLLKDHAKDNYGISINQIKNISLNKSKEYTPTIESNVKKLVNGVVAVIAKYSIDLSKMYKVSNEDIISLHLKFINKE